MVERGKYIVLEGSDGTGKSTQAIMLDTWLRDAGYNTLRVLNSETGNMEPVQEPGGTPEANAIRLRIKDKSIVRTPLENVQWFTEARKYIWFDAILPALEAGKYVVTARSWLSTLAYQGYGEGFPIEEIEAMTRQEVGEAYMNPDFVAVLAIKNERQRQARLNGRQGTAVELDTFESKPQAFQYSMQSGYQQLAHDRSLEIIDASLTQEQVFKEILERLRPIL